MYGIYLSSIYREVPSLFNDAHLRCCIKKRQVSLQLLKTSLDHQLADEQLLVYRPQVYTFIPINICNSLNLQIY